MKVPVIKKEKQFAFIEDEPITPNGTDVLIEVRNVGICGSDIHYWDIGQPEGLILGHEFSGLVLDPGNRKDLKIKDRVTALPISPCNTCPACKSGNVQYCEKTWSNAVGLSSTYKGAFSKLIKVRPDMVVKIPNNVSFEHAALTEPLAVSLHATNLVNITKNDKVLVIGAGIIGIACAMFAKNKKASLVSVSETNIKRAKKAVSLQVVDKYYDATKEDLQESILKDTTYGYDVVFECCGTSKAITSAIQAVRPGGTIILVGVSTFPTTIPTSLLVTKEVTTKGSIAYTKKEFEDCLNLISKKKVLTDELIDKVITIDKVQDAFEQLTSKDNNAIKILIDQTKK